MTQPPKRKKHVSPISAHFDLQLKPTDLSGGDALTSVVDLQLKGGEYAVFGKVVLANTDDATRNARVQLHHLGIASPPVLDESFARLASSGEASHTTIAVQSRLKVEAETVSLVEIRCATHLGRASNAQLAAIELNPEL